MTFEAARNAIDAGALAPASTPLRAARACGRSAALLAAFMASAGCGDSDMAALIGTWTGTAMPRGQNAATANAMLTLDNDSTFTLIVSTLYAPTAPQFPGCTEMIHAQGTWRSYPSMAGDVPWISAVFASGSNDARSGCVNASDDTAAPQDISTTNPAVFNYTLSNGTLMIRLTYSYNALGISMAPFDLARH